MIRASSAAQIEALVADLGSPSSTRREAAIARLIVAGSRAVGRLARVLELGTSTTEMRTGALRALEGIADPRGLNAAAAALGAADLATVEAAVAAVRPLLKGPRDADAVEALTALAVDPRRPARARIAAADALADLGAAAVKPLAKRLAADENVEMREWAAGRGRASAPPAPAAGALPIRVETLVERGLPDDPAIVRHAVGHDGPSVPLTALRRLIEAIREVERTAAARRRQEWVTVRAAAHAALASRGSRIALYDLRETLAESAGALPVEYLAAVEQIGDASCLEPLASAYARSTGSGEDWWRRHVRHAFHAIVHRERITRRHAAMKKVLARWPAIVQ